MAPIAIKATITRLEPHQLADIGCNTCEDYFLLRFPKEVEQKKEEEVSALITRLEAKELLAIGRAASEESFLLHFPAEEALDISNSQSVASSESAVNLTNSDSYSDSFVYQKSSDFDYYPVLTSPTLSNSAYSPNYIPVNSPRQTNTIESLPYKQSEIPIITIDSTPHKHSEIPVITIDSSPLQDSYSTTPIVIESSPESTARTPHLSHRLTCSKQLLFFNLF